MLLEVRLKERVLRKSWFFNTSKESGFKEIVRGGGKHDKMFSKIDREERRGDVEEHFFFLPLAFLY